MKTQYAIGLVATSVLITIAIEESRISSLHAGLKTGEQPAASLQAAVTPAIAANTDPAPPARTKSQPEARPDGPAKVKESEEESFAGTARRMWENPAGKSMMNQGAKMVVGMMYQDFIDGLKLSKEEGDYFKNLLCKEISDQQELGMKMLGASPDERTKLVEEITRRSKDSEAEIKKFLNSDEDFKSYTDYKNHMPERQQLDGIRAAMSGKGAPLDAAAETRLVDTMYRVRTESKAPDLSGPNAVNELANGNLVDAFEKNWTSQQETLKAETGKFLNEAQMDAFQEYQKQAKEMQLMGLKMAEKMMPGNKDGAK